MAGGVLVSLGMPDTRLVPKTKKRPAAKAIAQADHFGNGSGSRENMLIGFSYAIYR
jgi:hypothetical protein